MTLAHIVLVVAAFVAGAQNALAGGGSFITFPALLYAGFDPRAADGAGHIGPRAAACAQLMIAIYGGYFAGGAVRSAGATKNLLAAMMGASSVLIFLFQVKFNWQLVAPIALAALVGGQLGVYLLRRINETALAIGITLIGIGLTVALIVRY